MLFREFLYILMGKSNVWGGNGQFKNMLFREFLYILMEKSNVWGGGGQLTVQKHAIQGVIVHFDGEE